ncbi:MAG: hypothetical protein ABI837_13620 [Acidobacteriota bacterium]
MKYETPTIRQLSFDDILAMREQCPIGLAAKATELNAELDAAWIERAKSKHPRTKVKDVTHALKLLTFEESAATKEPFAMIAAEFHAKWTAQRDFLDTALRRLAATEAFSEPALRTEWIDWKSVRISTFYSQGFGAERYAMAAAEADADVARMYGIEVRIQQVDEIVVQVLVGGQRDVEILSRRPGPSLKEQIRAALRRGANVRVLHPLLPYGIEEKLGLDMFGNDLPART